METIARMVIWGIVFAGIGCAIWLAVEWRRRKKAEWDAAVAADWDSLDEEEVAAQFAADFKADMAKKDKEAIQAEWDAAIPAKAPLNVADQPLKIGVDPAGPFSDKTGYYIRDDDGKVIPLSQREFDEWLKVIDARGSKVRLDSLPDGSVVGVAETLQAWLERKKATDRTPPALTDAEKSTRYDKMMLGGENDGGPFTRSLADHEKSARHISLEPAPGHVLLKKGRAKMKAAREAFDPAKHRRKIKRKAKAAKKAPAKKAKR